MLKKIKEHLSGAFFGLENGVTTPELPSVEGRWTVATTVATLRRYQCIQVKGALSPMIFTPLATKTKQVFATAQNTFARRAFLGC